MISRQPVRLSGAGQEFGARCVGYGEMSLVEAGSVLLARWQQAGAGTNDSRTDATRDR